MKSDYFIPEAGEFTAEYMREVFPRANPYLIETKDVGLNHYLDTTATLTFGNWILHNIESKIIELLHQVLNRMIERNQSEMRVVATVRCNHKEYLDCEICIYVEFFNVDDAVLYKLTYG